MFIHQIEVQEVIIQAEVHRARIINHQEKVAAVVRFQVLQEIKDQLRAILHQEIVHVVHLHHVQLLAVRQVVHQGHLQVVHQVDHPLHHAVNLEAPVGEGNSEIKFQNNIISNNC